MSDLLKQTLTSHAVGATTQVMEVPVEQLERMSGKVRRLPLYPLVQCSLALFRLRNWKRSLPHNLLWKQS